MHLRSVLKILFNLVSVQWQDTNRLIEYNHKARELKVCHTAFSAHRRVGNYYCSLFMLPITMSHNITQHCLCNSDFVVKHSALVSVSMGVAN